MKYKTTCFLMYITLIFSSLLLCLINPVSAEDSSYYYDYINVDINLLQNGDMDITEVQKLDYLTGTYYYAYRWIPMDRVEGIDNVTVGEQNVIYHSNPQVRQWIEERQKSGASSGGETYAYTTWIDGNKFWIGWWFPETSGMSRTFEIKYTVHGGVRVNEPSDELYWKAIFSGRDTYVNSSKVTVHFPQSVPANSLETYSYGTPASPVIVDDRTVEYISGTLAADQELEIDVIFPHGIINTLPPAWQQGVENKEAYNQDIKPWVNFGLLLIGIVFVPIYGFIWLRGAFNARKKFPKPVASPGSMYRPPSDLPPAVVSMLMNYRVGATAVIATIFDLASRGVLRIEETVEKGMFGSSTKGVTIKKLKDGEKYSFEKTLVNTVASPEGRPLFASRASMYVLNKIFSQQVEEEAINEGLFMEKPSISMQRLSKPGLWMIVATIFIGIFFGVFLGGYAELFFVPFITIFVLGFVAIGLSGKLIMLTEKGNREVESWKAFAGYLKQTLKSGVIEEDTIGKWDSYLPYAVVFGITMPWINKFVEAEAPVPVWFYPLVFIHDTPSATSMAPASVPLSSVAGAFNSMTATIQSTFSGGSSGNGGSGGGGGGGGGGSG